jgi:hypothetical protein
MANTRYRPFAGGIDSADVLSPSPQRVWVITETIVAESSSVVSVELVHVDDPLNHNRRVLSRVLSRVHRQHTRELHHRPPTVRRVVQRQQHPSSTYVGHTSESLLEPWKPTAGCDQRSLVVFQRLAVSTGTATSKEYGNATPPRMFGGPKLMSNHAPSAWTATNSVGFSCKPDSVQRVITRLSHYCVERLTNQRSTQRRHRVDGHGPRSPRPRDHSQGRQTRHDPTRTANRTNGRPVHRRTNQRPVPGVGGGQRMWSICRDTCDLRRGIRGVGNHWTCCIRSMHGPPQSGFHDVHSQPWNTSPRATPETVAPASCTLTFRGSGQRRRGDGSSRHGLECPSKFLV